MLTFYNRLTLRFALGLALCMACIQASAVVFPIDLERDIKGIKVIVTYRTVEVGSTVVLTLGNLDQQKARCVVAFDPKVEQRKTRKRQIEPGKTASIHYSPGRKVNRLSIHVTCRPA